MAVKFLKYLLDSKILFFGYKGCIKYLLLLTLLAGGFSAISQPSETSPPPSSMDSLLEQQKKVHDTFARLDQTNNYTESLSYADMNILPMGFNFDTEWNWNKLIEDEYIKVSIKSSPSGKYKITSNNEITYLQE